MAVSAFSLVTPQEFKEFFPTSGTSQDPLIERVVNRASDVIEAYLDRQVVSRGNLTEFHTMQADGAMFQTENLWTLQWPIISIISLHEDTGWPKAYAAGSLLVADTGYQVAAPKGLIRRLGSAGAGSWNAGLRAIKIVYTAGYASTVTVPERIKGVALRLAAAMLKEAERKQHGILSVTDATGNFTRLGPATLTNDMKDDLASEVRRQVFVTGEAA